MARFTAGMKNVVELLNQMWDAFAAGPYNALPLTGENLTGSVTSSDSITVGKFVTAAARGAKTGAGTGGQAGWWRVARFDPSRQGGEATLNISGTTSYGASSLGSNGIVTTILARADNDNVVRGSFYSTGAFSGSTVSAVLVGDDGSIYVNTNTFFTLSVYLDTNMWLPCEVEFVGVNPPAGTHEASPVWGLKIGARNSLTVTDVAAIVNAELQTLRIIPLQDNAHDIGQASLAYRTVYARTGAINTSDARLKCDFRDLAPAEIAAARDLARVIGIYRWRDAVECKGDAAREHVGPTVQRAIEIMQAHGLDPFGYGFICYDAWERQIVEHPAVEARPAVPTTDAMPEVLGENGAVITPAVAASPGYPAVEPRAAYTEVTVEAGDRYAFRYDELAMFIAAGQEARLAALEAAK